MAEKDIGGIRGALTLLLADLDTDDRHEVLSGACPDLVVMKPTASVSQPLNLAASYLKAAKSICDGSSGLGALAAKNAAVQIDAAHSQIKVLFGRLGLENPYP